MGPGHAAAGPSCGTGLAVNSRGRWMQACWNASLTVFTDSAAPQSPIISRFAPPGFSWAPGRPAWQRLDDPDVAVISHVSAAAMYGVGDLRADIHEFTLPVRRQTRRPDIRVHRGRVPADRRVVLGGLPVTRAAWVIGQLLEDRVEPDAVADMTSEVLDRALDYPRVVAEVLAPYSARFGLKPSGGRALLDEFLSRAGNPDRERLLAEATDR